MADTMDAAMVAIRHMAMAMAEVAAIRQEVALR